MIDNILAKEELKREDIITLLSLDNPEDIEKLRLAAYDMMKNEIGEDISLRGLVEFSNICACDCKYCGLRAGNKKVVRYTVPIEEIVESAKRCAELGFGSFVMQSGERSDQAFVDYLVEAVKAVKEATKSELLPNGLGITLSTGEQTLENYKKLYAAGAHRYLLRIESSNKELYNSLHTDKQDWDHRVKCLGYLREAGFQVGTGVMIGFPGQTIEDLADDILFFKKMDVDMIGMGPFLINHDTPMVEFLEEWESSKENITKLALKMIAVTRLVLRDVNIASTTALETIHKNGKRLGLSYGANVVMPQFTPHKYREEYMLYDGKSVKDNYKLNQEHQFEFEIDGRPVVQNSWGDSHHFQRRQEKNK